MRFADIASRTNATTILREWFDALRDAGQRLENYTGEVIEETSFAVVNNQSSAANVTGLVFDSADVHAAFIDYRIRRVTTGGGATELVEAGQLTAIYRPSTGWELSIGPSSGDDAGLVFTITSIGQVQYTSTNITGTPSVSEMKFKARCIGA